jgi:hypothetical protein
MGQIQGEHLAIPVPIAAGATGLSGVVNISGMCLMAIKMPASWATANITFQACETPTGTFYDLYDDAGSEVLVTAAQQKVISCDSVALKLAPLQFIKIRSGTTATPVNQTGAPTLYLLVKA